jgi:hypothetical protein
MSKSSSSPTTDCSIQKDRAACFVVALLEVAKWRREEAIHAVTRSTRRLERANEDTFWSEQELKDKRSRTMMMTTT